MYFANKLTILPEALSPNPRRRKTPITESYFSRTVPSGMAAILLGWGAIMQEACLAHQVSPVPSAVLST